MVLDVGFQAMKEGWSESIIKFESGVSGSLTWSVKSIEVIWSQITVGTGSATIIGIPLANSKALDVTLQSLLCPRLSTVLERKSYHPAIISEVGVITYSLPSLVVSALTITSPPESTEPSHRF